MLLSVLLIGAAILYVFSILNSLWFKIKIPFWLLKPLKVTHILLLPFFLFPLLSFLFSAPIYYKGYYTNCIVFWCFLVTGFLLASFGIPIIKNRLLKTYLFILQYVWFLPIIMIFAVPLIGILMSYPILHFALPPGNEVFSNETYRIEEQNDNLNLLQRKYEQRYYLVRKAGLLKSKISFSLYVKTDSTPNYKNIEIESENDSLVYFTFSCDKTIIFDENDSLRNSITKKIAHK